MDRTCETHSDQQLRFLRELEEENASIAGNIVQICKGLWAIHGVIPVDGNVIMAEFDSYDDARSVLDQLCSGATGTRDL